MGRERGAAVTGRERAAEIRHRLASEIRAARRAAGLSQTAAAAAAGISRTKLGRLERVELRHLSFEDACRAAAAVGLRVGVGAYPDGDPARDAPQLRLLARFRAHLPPGAEWRTEVALPLPGDPRAWDATVRLLGRRAGCEGESRITDVQALERKLARKVRDGAVDLLILIVADTAANRRVLAAHREELRGLMPLDTRQVLEALRQGRLPGASGIVVL